MWLASDQARISAVASGLISSHRSALVVSSISAYEVGQKARKQKLTLPKPVNVWFPEILEAYQLKELPVTSQVALLASGLVWDHDDPFDRMIVASAIVNEATIITPDRYINQHPAVTCRW
jgi:PIN domain nuclease of toxin-antitoxin system